jgi:hypothetical protein
MKRWFLLFAAFLSGCASYSGYNLKPGSTNLESVLQNMGKPAMRWENKDGSSQLAYTRGPMGYHTFMVSIGADHTLQKIENVLEEKFFSRILPGLSKDEVIRIIGPSYPNWTDYFESRDELVMSWRFCDEWHESTRFNVLFDNSKGVVRSTIRLSETSTGISGTERSGC